MAIQDKFNRPNVIYKITKDIDLGGGTLTIPEGCTLDFQGGSFSNGTIVGNNTNIKANCEKIFDESINLEGIWDVPFVIPQWFSNSNDELSINYAINTAINISSSVKLVGTYNIKSTIKVDRNVDASEYSAYFTIFSDDSALLTTENDIVAFFSSDLGLTGSQLLSLKGLTFKANKTLNVYILDAARIIRSKIEGCSGDGVKLITANETYAQSIYINNCEIRNWANQLVYIPYHAYDIHISNCIFEAGESGMYIIKPQGCSIHGCLLENISNYAITIKDVFSISIVGNYFEFNNRDINILTPSSPYVNRSVFIAGNYFETKNGSTDNDLNTEYSVYWESVTNGVSVGNYCNKKLHYLYNNCNIFLQDTAAIKVSNISPICSDLNNIVESLPVSPNLYQECFSTRLQKKVFWNGYSWRNLDGSLLASNYGPSDSRPVLNSEIEYFVYFDTTLGKPIWWNKTLWVDATGTRV